MKIRGGAVSTSRISCVIFHRPSTSISVNNCLDKCAVRDVNPAVHWAVDA